MTSDAWQIYLRGQNTRHKETEESIPLRAKISRGWPLTACKSDNKSHPSVPLSKYRGRWWNGASRGLRLASTPAKSCTSQPCTLPPEAFAWCRPQSCSSAEKWKGCCRHVACFGRKSKQRFGDVAWILKRSATDQLFWLFVSKLYWTWNTFSSR